MLGDYHVPGHDLRADLSLKFKEEDASGETSSTASAAKGTKGKKLGVTVFLRFTEEDDLRALLEVAQAKEKGENKVYTITNLTANAAGMREGRFSGDFKVTPQEKLRVWQISFTIAEHLSVPERAEGAGQGNEAGETEGAAQESHLMENVGKVVGSFAKETVSIGKNIKYLGGTEEKPNTVAGLMGNAIKGAGDQLKKLQ